VRREGCGSRRTLFHLTRTRLRAGLRVSHGWASVRPTAMAGRYSSEIRTGCANQRPSGSVRGCALKAHGVQFPEMETAAKPSSQPRTESCVMSGNGHCEAETGRLQAGTSVNDKIAPKSIEMEVADLIPQRGRQEHWMRYGKDPVMLPGFVPPACSQRILWEQGRSDGFKRS
jgi:hypothetical protein